MQKNENRLRFSCWLICKVYIMSLSIYSAKNYSTKLKVTVQKTGKLGFTADTATSLHLTPDTYIKIACDEEQADNLYMIVCNEPDEDGFKVSLNSGYYSLPTTMLLKELGLDNAQYTVIFDLSRESSLDEEVGGKVYKMNKRINSKKKKEVAMR